ncbi:hypothetical protein D3C81_1827140 [compost metagenome]
MYDLARYRSGAAENAADDQLLVTVDARFCRTIRYEYQEPPAGGFIQGTVCVIADRSTVPGQADDE